MKDKIKVIDDLLDNYFVCISWEIFDAIRESYVNHSPKAKHKLYHDFIPTEQIEVYISENSIRRGSKALVGNYHNIHKYIKMKVFI